MTPEKAIEEQQLFLQHSDQWNHERLDKSLKLGIEALREIQRARVVGLFPDNHQLPGETID